MFRLKEMPDTPEKLFDEKKKKFFFTFIRKYPEAVKIYEEHGLLPKNRKDSSQDWSNVARHCVTEAAAAETLAELLRLSAEEKEAIILAPFYHDFYKKKSIELIKANPDNPIEADDQANLEARQYMKKNIGEKVGKKENKINEQVISIIDNSLGHDSFLPGKMETMTLSEKIMHYLDDITLGENLVNLKERMAALKIRYPNINEKGITKYGKPTYDQQYEFGSEIEADLAKRLGLEKPEELPNFIKEKIREKINKLELID